MTSVYLDMDGNEVFVGDILESPGRASDPIVITVETLYREWPFDIPKAFARTGNWDGQGVVNCTLSEGLVLRRADGTRLTS